MIKTFRGIASAVAVVAAALLVQPVLPAIAAEGAITIVLPEAPHNLEPCAMVLSDIGRIIKQNVNETLTEINPNDGSVTPRLATSWDQVNDRTWDFHLRQGVLFHDGAPFNAAAVVYTINRLMDKNIICDARSKSLAGVNLTAKVIDDSTVEIAGDQPIPIFPTMMGAVGIVSPNTPKDEATRDPVGTGPYKFVSWTPESVVLVRNDKYWGSKPDITQVTFVFRTESAVRAAMVQNGEADLAPDIAEQDATDPKTDFSYFNSETTRFRIDATQPPFNDLRVRQALNLAVDRDSLRGSIFSKDAVPARELVTPSISGYNPNIPVWPYDPDKAKQLLAAAKADGVPVDAPIHIIGRINIYPNASEAAEALMAMWQAVGFNVDLKMLEVGEWFKYQDKPYPPNAGPTLLQESVDNNNGDAVFTVFNKYDSQGQTSAYSDAQLDSTIEKAEAAKGDERKQLWQQAFDRVETQLVLEVPLFHMIGYTRVGARIDWRPSISTNSELQVATMKLKY